MHRDLPDEYYNITVARDIEVPQLSFLESIASIDSENAAGDVIDGLVVAVQMSALPVMQIVAFLIVVDSRAIHHPLLVTCVSRFVQSMSASRNSSSLNAYF
jgi:hypothetical protein